MPRACLAGATVSVDAVKDAVEEAMMPKHVAIIMDGNGKWARDRKLAVGDGLRAGCRISQPSFPTVMEVDLMMSSTENYIRTDVKELKTR
ncbi:hypothetical protein SASPL_137528 [Salvia splendens]|uniref:Isoprenyl transferase n=1 Tax=Salvia splendens TaxID=180675 RepID=A0A8X8WTJ1_SALSN|nr:hypothetical protein SASPL_137528 [Salvia splendens]